VFGHEGSGGDKTNVKYFEEKSLTILPVRRSTVRTGDPIDLCNTGGMYTYLHCLSHGQQNTCH
jgi:hypothetical protein